MVCTINTSPPIVISYLIDSRCLSSIALLELAPVCLHAMSVLGGTSRGELVCHRPVAIVISLMPHYCAWCSLGKSSVPMSPCRPARRPPANERSPAPCPRGARGHPQTASAGYAAWAPAGRSSRPRQGRRPYPIPQGPLATAPPERCAHTAISAHGKHGGVTRQDLGPLRDVTSGGTPAV